MTLVVDASVAIKWVLNEEGSAAARSIIPGERLIAPDFLVLECANVLALKVRRGLLAGPEAPVGLRWITSAGVRLMASSEHVVEAQRLASDLGQTVYDSLYLSVALSERAPLLTADARFARAAEKAYPAHVRRL